ncbi:MAG: peptide chain release factor 2 [Clostridiales bacterium]|nr:peptide chain release factor 2 [Clostridiales bacterium]
MIDFYKQRQELDRLNNEYITLYDALKIEALKADVKNLTKLQAEKDFWQDAKKAQEITRKITTSNKTIKQLNDLKAGLENASAYLDLVEELNEISEVENAKKEVEKLTKFVQELSVQALLKGKYDAKSAILTLHAGAGGTEAQDWVEMLYRMYTRYAERKGYLVKLVDKLDGEEAGIKNITFMVEGENAYGYLKAEMGVHRLVRISPFDASKRRHTSFASLEVMPEIDDDDDVVIKQDDLRIDTFHSGGAGGQNVNKTASAVRITHLPTGIVVQCQNERSQLQNKEQAMKVLASKLVEKRERENLEKAMSLKGEMKKIEWGSQIRSYVFCPYTMVKDHRTNYERSDIDTVMDGDISDFIVEYLKRI